MVSCSAEPLSRLFGRLGQRVGGGGIRNHLVVMLIAAQSTAEIPQSPTEGASDFRQPLRSQYEQRDHENEQQMCWLKDVADHSSEA